MVDTCVCFMPETRSCLDKKGTLRSSSDHAKSLRPEHNPNHGHNLQALEMKPAASQAQGGKQQARWVLMVKVSITILGGSWYLLTSYSCTYNCTYNHIRALKGLMNVP